MSDSVYLSDPDPEPDDHFLAGGLELAAVGNRGRLLDARRTPLSITAVDVERGEVEVRIDAFEDEGAYWRLPAWELWRIQLSRASQRASSTVVTGLRAASDRFDRPLVVAANPTAAVRTLRRVEEQRGRMRPALRTVLAPGTLEGCVTRREGERQLYELVEQNLADLDLLEVDRVFCAAMVSNPRSGEVVKGHAIVLAELGLCPFEGTLVRDGGLFDGSWSRACRAEHLILRMAFAQELWAQLNRPLRLFRGAASDTPMTHAQKASFVSCTFAEDVADAHFAGGPTTHAAVKWRQDVNPVRLVMTFLETRAFNERFKEAEALLVGQPSNSVF